MHLTIHLLDEVRLADGKEEIRMPTRQVADLLAHLALHPNESIPRIHLANRIWQSADDLHALNSLCVALSMLRKAVRQLDGDPASMLRGNRQSIELRFDKGRIDYWQSLARGESPNERLPAHLRPSPPAHVAPDWLVGRRTELKRLGDFLAHRKQGFVSIVAAGGMGKTSLIRRALEDCSGSVAWVEMVGISNSTLFLDRLSAALNIEPIRSIETLSSRLGPDDDFVLVLDACEQAECDMAGFVRVLGRMPQFRLVTTSRTPFCMAEERLIRISPLSCQVAENGGLSEAADLLLRRLHQILGPTFNPRPRYLEAVASGAEGVPLIVEIAARNWSNGYLPEQAVALKEQKATLMWSYDRASAVARRAWEMLALLAIPVPQEVMGEVFAEPEMHQAFRELIVLGVLYIETKQGIPTLRMLDTHRVLAIERMDGASKASTYKDLARRWTLWLLGQGRALQGDSPQDAIVNLELLLSDLTPVLEHALTADSINVLVDLFPFFYNHEIPEATYEWASRLGEVVVHAPRETRIRWMAVESTFEVLRRFSFCEEREARISEILGDGTAGVLRDQCRAMSQALIPNQEPSGSVFWRCYGDLVQSNLRRRQTSEVWPATQGISELKVVERQSQRHDHLLPRICALDELGYLLVASGQFEEAERTLNRAIKLRNEAKLTKSSSSWALAWCCGLSGRSSRCFALLEALLVDEKLRRRPLVKAHVAYYWLEAALDTRDWHMVEHAWEAMEETWGHVAPSYHAAVVPAFEARIAQERGDMERSRQLLAEALDPRKVADHRNYLASQLAWLDLREGNLPLAKDAFVSDAIRAFRRCELVRAVPALEQLALVRSDELGRRKTAGALACLTAWQRAKGQVRATRQTEIINHYGFNPTAESWNQEPLQACVTGTALECLNLPMLLGMGKQPDAASENNAYPK